MLALLGAISFGLALILVWAEESIGDVFTPTTLQLIGFTLIALHLAGVGTAYDWRTRARGRSRSRR